MTWKDDVKKEEYMGGRGTRNYLLNNLLEAIKVALLANDMVKNSNTSEISEKDKILLTSSSLELDKAQKQIERMMRSD